MVLFGGWAGPNHTGLGRSTAPNHTSFGAAGSSCVGASPKAFAPAWPRTAVLVFAVLAAMASQLSASFALAGSSAGQPPEAEGTALPLPLAGAEAMDALRRVDEVAPLPDAPLIFTAAEAEQLRAQLGSHKRAQVASTANFVLKFVRWMASDEEGRPTVLSMDLSSKQEWLALKRADKQARSTSTSVASSFGRASSRNCRPRSSRTSSAYALAGTAGA